jgi:hypothetical protein
MIIYAWLNFFNLYFPLYHTPTFNTFPFQIYRLLLYKLLCSYPFRSDQFHKI